jgi:hypothetical protein
MFLSKGKSCPPEAMKAYRGVEIELHSFLTLALEGASGQLHSLATSMSH